MSVLIDLIGQKFNRLKIIDRATNSRENRAMWHCLCDCGNTTIVGGKNLRQGKTKSCGCAKKGVNRKHGMRNTIEWVTWSHMRSRCNNPNYKEYRYYGGRSITICERWDDFAKFFSDMGSRPSTKYSIDRVDNDGNYEPSNCRWATQMQQVHNRNLFKTNTTGFTGVSRRPNGKYLAEIRHKGQYHHLYYGDDLNEAARKRKDGEVKYWNR